jgi:predicted Ser/Thr protein kinase
MKRPHPKRKSEPLFVYSDLWAKSRCYRDREGNRVEIEQYQEAREYAARNGYDGIRVKYCQFPS